MPADPSKRDVNDPSRKEGPTGAHHDALNLADESSPLAAMAGDGRCKTSSRGVNTAMT